MTMSGRAELEELTTRSRLRPSLYLIKGGALPDSPPKYRWRVKINKTWTYNVLGSWAADAEAEAVSQWRSDLSAGDQRSTFIRHIVTEHLGDA